MGSTGIEIRAQMRLKNGKNPRNSIKRELFWPRVQPKCARGQPQAISDRPRGQPRRYATKERGSTTFRVWPFRSQPPPRSMRSPTRCEHPPTTKPVRAVRWVCPEPADDFARSKRWKSSHRGGRIEVDAGRIESFEGAPARNHGPGDRRGVIVDDFRHCGAPHGGNKRHRRGFQPTLPRNRPLPATHASPKSAQRSRGV